MKAKSFLEVASQLMLMLNTTERTIGLTLRMKPRKQHVSPWGISTADEKLNSTKTTLKR